MYNNPYYQNAYNPQVSIDRINNQIADLEKMRQQLQQPPQQQPTNLTQNFQLVPNNTAIKYANNIDEVNREVVAGDTPYFSKDMSVVWIKNIKGDIKTYELSEIVPKDERDLLIDSLQMQVNELRKEMKKNEQYVSDIDEPNKNEKPTSISNGRTSKKEPKKSDGDV